MMPGGFFSMTWMWLVPLLLVLLFVLVLASVLHFSRRKDAGSKTPMGILEKRFTRGGMDKEEFERMKQDLEST